MVGMTNKWVCKMIDGKFTLIPIEDSGPTVRTEILTDTIEPTWHPVSGEYCSSRTGMIKIAKQHGMEELGNDRIERKDNYDKKGLKEDLLRAYDQTNKH